ncbi:MAG: hypothetical protein WA130_13110 [Candidatus Methanoperedens sp.]
MDYPAIPEAAFKTMPKALVVCGVLVMIASSFANSMMSMWLFGAAWLMIVIGAILYIFTYQSKNKEEK